MKNNPAESLFYSHWVVYINGRYYDPSYGQSYNSLEEIDNKAIAGFYVEAQYPVNGIETNVFLIRKNPVGLNLIEKRSNY